jgi:hypothetical protein
MDDAIYLVACDEHLNNFQRGQILALQLKRRGQYVEQKKGGSGGAGGGGV